MDKYHWMILGLCEIRENDELPTMVKKRKLRWFGHVLRSSGFFRARTVNGKGRRGVEEMLKRQKGNIQNGQGWTMPAHLGQLLTGQDGKGLLRSNM